LLAIGAAPVAFGQADPTKLFCASPTDLCIEKDDMIPNPTKGVLEKVVSLVFNPYGSVLTDAGHYIWAGPLTIGYTFTIPAVPAVPHLDAIPADNSVTPPRPARPEQLAVDAIPARNMVITGIVRAPDTDPSDDDDDPPPPPQRSPTSISRSRRLATASRPDSPDRVARIRRACRCRCPWPANSTSTRTNASAAGATTAATAGVSKSASSAAGPSVNPRRAARPVRTARSSPT
jgi:hypothetical protein